MVIYLTAMDGPRSQGQSPSDQQKGVDMSGFLVTIMCVMKLMAASQFNVQLEDHLRS